MCAVYPFCSEQLLCCSAGCECPVLFCQLLWLLPPCQGELTILPSTCPMALSHSSCRPGCPRITGGARDLEVADGCYLHHPFPSSDKSMHQIVPCEPQLEVISHPLFSVGQSSDSSVSSQNMSGGKCCNQCSILCQILSVRK